MRRLVALIVAVAAVVAPAAARAVSFGPNLNGMTANNSIPCGWASYYGCTVHDLVSSTHMLTVLGDPVTHGDQSGVVTQIRVLSADTMPVQFVVVEWSSKISDPHPFPSGVAAVSDQVTLHPGLNTFNTNLPVDSRLSKGSPGWESWSAVSMSILSTTARIPAQTIPGGLATLGILTDNFGPLTTTSSDLTVGHNMQTPSGIPATLLMSGDVQVNALTPTPAPTPTPTPTPAPTPTPTPAPALAQLALPTTARISRSAAKLPLRCVGAANCAGTLRIQSGRVAHAATAAAAAKLVTYASATFSIAAGKTATVTVKLGAAGKRALARRRSVTAYANASFSDGRVVSTKITLRR